MNFRRLAETVSRCVESPTARIQIYRVIVRMIGEVGALEVLWGIDLKLDREIHQFQLDYETGWTFPSPNGRAINTADTPP